METDRLTVRRGVVLTRRAMVVASAIRLVSVCATKGLRGLRATRVTRTSTGRPATCTATARRRVAVMVVAGE